MANRSNHYETAFEAYLRQFKLPYVAVNEHRRSLSTEGSIKNPDFLVSPSHAPDSWLIDVKGRRFPSGKQFWRNWSTCDDLESLAHWERLFGAGFRGLLVFAYLIDGDLAPLPVDELFTYHRKLYGFVAVRLDHYLGGAQNLSSKWGTVSLPAAAFRNLARPLSSFLLPQAACS